MRTEQLKLTHINRALLEAFESVFESQLKIASQYTEL